jgi:hypothetical protein
MKSRTTLIAGGALLLIAAGGMLLPQSKEVGPTVQTSRASQASPQGATGNDDGRFAPRQADAEPVAKGANLRDEERSAILNTIEQASVTYDAKALPLIEPYLLHQDPEVRLAAMNGMIVLGEAAAGPLLRKAAEKSTSPKEAVALSEAADFVELPSGTFVPKERTALGTRKPGKPRERPNPRLAPSAQPKDDPSPSGE